VAVKRQTNDWAAQTANDAKVIEAALIRSVPAQWAGPVRGLRGSDKAGKLVKSSYAMATGPRAGVVVEGVRLLGDHEVSGAWLERLKEFTEKHGGALRWSMSDSEVCELAKVMASKVFDLMAALPVELAGPQLPGAETPELGFLYPALTDAQSLDAVLCACDALDIDVPKAVFAAGVIARATSQQWWRRALRKKVARVVESGAIKLGLVSKSAGAYCSNEAVERRIAQKARNEAILKKSVMRNEAGQCFTLYDLAQKSVANPQVRGGELMTRIRGCEEFALASGHVGLFFTQSTPSRFHPVRVLNKAGMTSPNPRYDGVSNPRDGQLWLRTMWARARAEFHRQGIEVYGFRVAEPHHDGTPHWHSLLWVPGAAQAVEVEAIMRKHWLSDGGDERGAAAHRLRCDRMKDGGAAGYIAKYIAKNIGNVDVGEHLDTADGFTAAVWSGDVSGAARVDAWASLWGIRQFQSIGQPSVGVWRELRRVSVDQADSARVEGLKSDRIADKLLGAVHKVGDKKACWNSFLNLMGGVALKRGAWAVKLAKRVNDGVNDYAEKIVRKVVVGVELPSGRWLISRRQSWGRVFNEPVQSPAESAALAAPWTRFTNCTARLGGELRAALLGLKTKHLFEPARNWDCPIMGGGRLCQAL
jgi:Bacteriophage replication gene A protein (GPA)